VGHKIVFHPSRPKRKIAVSVAASALSDGSKPPISHLKSESELKAIDNEMVCYKCKQALDLDISMRGVFNRKGEEGLCINNHHGSYDNLCQAAEAGSACAYMFATPFNSA
jgi:hypothetical protein